VKQTGRKRQFPSWGESHQGTDGVYEIVGTGVQPLSFFRVEKNMFLPAKADNAWEQFEKPG